VFKIFLFMRSYSPFLKADINILSQFIQIIRTISKEKWLQNIYWSFFKIMYAK